MTIPRFSTRFRLWAAMLLCEFGFAVMALARPAANECEPQPVDEPVAVVTLMKGRWQISIGETPIPLCGGQKLPAGARLAATSKKATVHIASSDERGVTYSVSGNSAEPTFILVDPGTKEALNFPERILVAARLLFSSREVYIPPTPRSARIKLEDSVVGLAPDHHLDLGQVFAAALPGDYELMLQEWVEPPDGPGWRRVRLLEYRWPPDGPATIEVPELEPGLYRIQLLQDGVATLDDAWILLSSAETHVSDVDDFRRFKEQMPWWGGLSDSPEAHGLRRAYLHQLARGREEALTAVRERQP